MARSRVQLQFALGQIRRLRLAARLGEENAARTCARRAATSIFARGIGGWADVRCALERGADAARARRVDPQLFADALGEEDSGMVAIAERCAEGADSTEQQVRVGRARSEFL